MANLSEYEKLTSKERRNRTFSEEFRRKKVGEIERCVTSVSEVSREYQVTRTAIYKWMRQYSPMKKKQVRLVLESLSDTRKIEALKEKVKDLEQAVGQKQIQIDFFDKMIELAEEEYGIDIKKNVLQSPPVVLVEPGKAPVQNESGVSGDGYQQAGVSPAY